MSITSINSVSPRSPHTLRARRGGLALAGLAGAALVLAACGSSSSSTAAPVPAVVTPSAVVAAGTVLKTESTPLGVILSDSQGRTVYMFAADTPGHSACTGTCLTYWPIVPAPSTLPASVPGVTAKLGVLDRPDGTKQLTVAGMPIYTFSGDTTPGAATGQGKNLSGGAWWVLSPSGALVKVTAGGGAGTSPSPAGATPTPSKSTSTGGGGWA
jgi:predicted lipoprotein with Yx(FWY)xxD motif